MFPFSIVISLFLCKVSVHAICELVKAVWVNRYNIGWVLERRWMRENRVLLHQDTLACKNSWGRYYFRKRQIPISLMVDSFLSRLKLEIKTLNLSIKVNRLSEQQIMNSSLFVKVTLFHLRQKLLELYFVYLTRSSTRLLPTNTCSYLDKNR